MYKRITDPYTQTSYYIKSKKGINILKKYLNYSMRGGASAGADDEWKKYIDSKSGNEYWWKTDPVSGRKYWWNNDTQETNWENPMEKTVNADESSECVCGGINQRCSCKDATTDETKAELAKVLAENELLREAVIRLSIKLNK